MHDLDVLKSERAKIDRKIDAVTRELEAITTPAAVPGEPEPFTEAEAEGEATSINMFAAPSLLGSRTYAEQAMDLIAKKPEISYAELAQALYGGTNEAAKNKARSVIYFLVKRAKKLRPRNGGGWDVAPPVTTDSMVLTS